jgi:hypothetical protein
MPNAYPSFDILRESDADAVSGFDAVRATNGSLRVRQRWAADKIDFTLVHRLTVAQFATYIAFYNANRLLDVSLTWPETGATHTVRFVGAPKRALVNGRYTVRAVLQEV